MVTGTTTISQSPLDDAAAVAAGFASFEPVTPAVLDALRAAVPGSNVLTDPASVEKLSKDFYWYSPVLESQLKDLRAEVVVQPANTAEVEAVLRFAFAHHLPVTARGARHGQLRPGGSHARGHPARSGAHGQNPGDRAGRCRALRAGREAGGD